jgi:Neutral/alkaline non-lysosomal ceramidase, N-terminal
MWKKVCCAGLLYTLWPVTWSMASDKEEFRVGAAAVAITPFGQNADWDGSVTDTGVWGEKFVDKNHNGRWDLGEPFEDDPANTSLDHGSHQKYDGIYLAGFGNDRLATSKHDDLWARALVLEYGARRIAIVSVDLLGYYSNAKYYGAGEVRKLLDPKLAIEEVLITSTHDHEGPDTVGVWGVDPLHDGKYPRYLHFVDREIAKAINQAAQSAQPVRMRLGRTDPQRSPSLANLQTRTEGRPPQFFDEEMRVMQFVGTAAASKDKTIATIVNWNTHPESMEDENTILTSDFPHAVRENLEEKYGGTAIYISGDLGAVEIVGDGDQGTRTRFDGVDFPVAKGHQGKSVSFARTEAIGRDVAKAAVDALDRAEWSLVSGIEVKKAPLQVPMDNEGYAVLMQKGVLNALPMPKEGELPTVSTWVYEITFGDAQLITAPGELFPEILYGVAKHRRLDCPAADTQRPPEPAVWGRMKGKYKFILGLSPDEMGYMIPGYDFLRPTLDAEHGAIKESPDPCKAKGVPDHYHETNSASSQIGRAWACISSALLDGKMPDVPACQGIKYEPVTGQP